MSAMGASKSVMRYDTIEREYKVALNVVISNKCVQVCCFEPVPWKSLWSCCVVCHGMGYTSASSWWIFA